MAHGKHGSDEHHIIPLSTYYKVLGALLVLTVVTVLAAQFHFGAFNTIIAIGIASVKAALVLAIFMHLKYDDRLYLVLILTSVFFLIVMYFFSVLDIFTRVAETSIL